jgi:hypothetical protein
VYLCIKKKKNNSSILQRGPLTGHMHTVGSDLEDYTTNFAPEEQTLNFISLLGSLHWCFE